MLHRCDECPGTYELQQYLENKLEDAILQDEVVNFKYWIFAIEDFLKHDSVTVHSFIKVAIKY